jgi:splicing factor U2AF subunit
VCVRCPPPQAPSQLADAAKLGLAALAGSVPPAATTLAAAAATLTVTTPTNIVLLENMVSCGTIRDESERKEVRGRGCCGVGAGRA